MMPTPGQSHLFVSLVRENRHVSHIAIPHISKTHPMICLSVSLDWVGAVALGT